MSEDTGAECTALTVMSALPPDILTSVGVPAWCDSRHLAAAVALASGSTQEVAAEQAGVTDRTVWRWLRERGEQSEQFQGLIGRLAFHVGLADRRVRMVETNRLYQAITKRDIGQALRKHDAVDLIRLAGELAGDGGAGPLPASVQVVREVLANIQVNVSVSGGGDPVATSSAAVIEGDVRDITEES